MKTKNVYILDNRAILYVNGEDAEEFLQNLISNNIKKVNKNCLLYLQPEWSKRDKIMPIIVDYAMKNPKWRVSLQTHKYLNIP